MELQDLFVGIVAIGLGLAAIWTAAANWEGPFQLQRQMGRGPARLAYVAVGTLLVIAGVAVIAGFAPGWLGLPTLERP